MNIRGEIAEARRWVIKVGSALLTDNGKGLDGRMITDLVNQLVQLRGRGCEVVLVSSGAVAAGIVQLGWKNRPTALHDLQAAAAVGQMGLVQSYQSAFQQHTSLFVWMMMEWNHGSFVHFQVLQHQVFAVGSPQTTTW